MSHSCFCSSISASVGRSPTAASTTGPILTGNDLMEMGLTPGPRFKTLLEKVREAQLDGTVRTKDEAIALVRKLLEELGP